MWKSILLSLSVSFLGYCDDQNVQDRPIKKNDQIKQVIEKENENFFSTRSIQLQLLKDCPEVIPTLADWLYEEWHLYDLSLTKEKLMNSYKGRLSNDGIPITFVVVKEDTAIGTISLKRQNAPELSDFPKDSLWMGNLQVSLEERNQGLGGELFKLVQKVARIFGYEKLYFYTSNPVNIQWYVKRGAHVLEERPFREHIITIMELPLQEKY